VKVIKNAPGGNSRSAFLDNAIISSAEKHVELAKTKEASFQLCLRKSSLYNSIIGRAL
jgi:hypothetical protein